MTGRTFVENGIFTSMGNEGELDERAHRNNLPGARRGHSQVNRPKPTMRQKTARRVDMTGHLSANKNYDDDSDSDDDYESSLPRNDRLPTNRNIMSPQEMGLDDVEIRIQNVMSGYKNHQRLLLGYREQKEKIQSAKHGEDMIQPQVHNDTNATLAAHHLWASRIRQDDTLGADESNPKHLSSSKRPLGQHRNTRASNHQPATTTTTTKTGVNANDSSTAAYFLTKIQAFDKIINSFSSPEKKKRADGAAPHPLEKVSDQDESTVHEKQNKIVYSPLRKKSSLKFTDKNNLGSRDVSTSKRTDKNNDARIPRELPAIQGDGTANVTSKVQPERGEAYLENEKSDDVVIFHRLPQINCDPNETMSTWSSSRDVEMAKPPLGETVSEAAVVHQSLKRHHRFLTTSGVLLAIILIFGIGMLLGYLSSINLTG